MFRVNVANTPEGVTSLLAAGFERAHGFDVKLSHVSLWVGELIGGTGESCTSPSVETSPDDLPFFFYNEGAEVGIEHRFTGNPTLLG